jgi:hypothetical protein
MAAARLAAMRERIKNKENVVVKRTETHVKEMCKQMDKEDAEAKARQRNETMQRLKADAEAKCTMGNVAAAAAVDATTEPAAKRMRGAGDKPAIPKCGCGFVAVHARVNKEGAHFGRPFFKCGKEEQEQRCTFFVWEQLLQHQAGESQIATQMVEEKEVLCSCGLPPKQFTVRKEGVNLGRTFRKCAEEKCKFFMWDTQFAEQTTNGTAESTDRASANKGLAMGYTSSGMDNAGSQAHEKPCQCSCGLDAVQRTVRKEGPNSGRTFWKCASGQCNFFKWHDQEASAAQGTPSPDSTNPNSVSTQKIGGRESSCYKCGQSGHWARECPSTAAQSDHSSSIAGGPQSSAGKTMSCFKCGQSGHWARNCPGAPP